MLKAKSVNEGIRLEKIKILFQFLIMLVASVVLGVCLSRLFSDELRARAFSDIIRHFSAQAANSSASSLFFKYLSFSLFDIISILSLVIFSFSFINYVVSDIIIVIYGTRLGIGASLALALQDIQVFEKIIFFSFRSLIIILIIIFCYKMALYSLELRRFSSNGRFAADKRKTISIIAFALAFLGLILIINGLYCICLYIF